MTMGHAPDREKRIFHEYEGVTAHQHVVPYKCVPSGGGGGAGDRTRARAVREPWHSKFILAEDRFYNLFPLRRISIADGR